MSSLNRRRFLRRLGLVSMLAPGIGRLVSSAQAATASRKNAVFVYIPDGCIPAQWHPAATGTSFSLPAMTKPLEPYKSDLVFLNGLEMYAGGSTHEGGIRKVMTGNADQSLDAHLANLYRNNAFSSVYLGVAANHENGAGGFSFLGANQPQLPEDNPIRAFNRLFGGSSGSSLDLNSLRRKSILDTALADLRQLQTGLGQTEKEKLQTNLDALREVEARIQAANTGGSCTQPVFNTEGFSVPDGWHGYPSIFNREEHFALMGKLQMDLTVLALSCGLTQVVNLQWSHAVSGTRLVPETGVTLMHHDASHYGEPSSQTAQDFVKLKAWYLQQFGYLLGKMKNTGNLLHDSLVFLFSELGDSNAHDHRNMPFILAGQAGGQLQTGRSLHYNGDAHAKLLVSIANLMGSPIDNFGYTGKGTGGLVGL